MPQSPFPYLEIFDTERENAEMGFIGVTRGSHLGQLRLEVRHVPAGHRRAQALRSTARHQPDVLTGVRSDTGCSTVLIPWVEEPVILTP
jgi:hypothetical protein